jgi:hypothetical protein
MPANRPHNLTVIVADQPVAEVLEVLNEALERARAGDIVGVGLAYAVRGGGTGTAFAGGPGTRSHLVHATRLLDLRLLGFVDDEEEG